MRNIGIGNLFKKKTEKKPAAAVFVDFEHWYISITKLHGTKPNIKTWARSLAKKYDIKDISFFGDFSNPSLAGEILKIRAVTNNIIQTSNTGNYKKDFTDFIMLDHIYQKAMFSPDIDAFIIFSGDGHFSSAASCLKNNCGKEVGIYGVKDAFSHQLKEIATWFEEVPSKTELYEKYFDMILTNLKELETTSVNSRPSFSKTVEAVSNIYGAPEEKIREALSILIESGYILRKETAYGRKKVMTLDIDWDKINEDEIWVKDPFLKKKEEPKKTVAIIEKKKEPKKPTAKPEKKTETKQGKKTEKPVNKEVKKPETKTEPKKAPPKPALKKPALKKTVEESKPEEKVTVTGTVIMPVTAAPKKKKRKYYPPKKKTTAE